MYAIQINENGLVVGRHSQPHTIPEDEIELFHLVSEEDILPPKENYAVYYNTETQEFFYQEIMEEPPEPEPLDPIEELELNMYESIAEVYEEQLIGQLDMYEATASVYEEHLLAQLDNYETFAELYEFVLAQTGGEA